MIVSRRYDLLVSALFPDEYGLKFRAMCVMPFSCLKPPTILTFRSRAMVELERLVGKYPDGYEGYEAQADYPHDKVRRNC